MKDDPAGRRDEWDEKMGVRMFVRQKASEKQSFWAAHCIFMHDRNGSAAEKILYNSNFLQFLTSLIPEGCRAFMPKPVRFPVLKYLVEYNTALTWKKNDCFIAYACHFECRMTGLGDTFPFFLFFFFLILPSSFLSFVSLIFWITTLIPPIAKLDNVAANRR